MENQNGQAERPYSPLAGNVDEKGYATNMGAAHADPIPEPKITPPSFRERKDFWAEESETDKGGKTPTAPPPQRIATGGPKKAPPREPADPGYGEMSNVEKKRAAEALTTSVLQGYGLLCKQGGKWVTVKRATVDRMVREGRIDTSVLYATPAGDHATAVEIINAFNGEIEEIFEVSEEFQDEVRPIMTRVFMKRGAGMSDEMQLAWLFGKDISVKAAMAFSLKKQSSAFIKSFTIQNQAAGRPAPGPAAKEAEPTDTDEVQAPPSPTPPPPPAAAPKKKAKVRHMDAPKSNTATVSPAMKESAPGEFFDDVDVDAPIDEPSFGDPATLAGIDHVASLPTPEKPVKKKPSPKKKK